MGRNRISSGCNLNLFASLMTSKLEAVIGVWLSGGKQRLQNCKCNSCIMDARLVVHGEGVFPAQEEG